VNALDRREYAIINQSDFHGNRSFACPFKSMQDDIHLEELS
jgi:hypothetical protein